MSEKEIKNKTIDYALAAKVSDRVNIENITLIKSSFFRKPDTNRFKIFLKAGFNVRYKIDRKNSVIMVFPELNLDGSKEKDEKGESSLHIEAVFVLIYKAKSLEGLKDKNFKAFADANGIYNVWPYWREFVQSTVSRMGLPPLIIPAFHIFSSREEKR